MDWLIANGYKLTPQRRLVLEVFLDSPEHVTAEDVFIRARRIDPGIGIATVYRNMKLLALSGVARTVRFDDGATRYEIRHSAPDHDHIICVRCGRRTGIGSPEIDRLRRELADRHDFSLTGHRLFLYGVCEDCRRKRGED